MRGLQNFSGVLLRQHREAAKLTQGDLGNRAGIDATVVSRYEADRRRPDLPTAARLANALNIALTDLLVDQEQPGDSATLQHLRERSGNTQAQVAAALDIKPAAYSKIERGLTTRVTADRVALLAEVFKVDEAAVLAALRRCAVETMPRPA